MPTSSKDVDDLRRQMATIRRELHEDVKGVVATANAVTDWRRYLTSYPLVSLGAAVAIGYLIVPSRKKVIETVPLSAYERVKEAARTLKAGAVPVAVPVEVPKKPSLVKSLLSAGLGMATPLALRAAQGYAIKYLEQWMLQQQEHLHGVAGRQDPSARPTPARATGNNPF